MFQYVFTDKIIIGIFLVQFLQTEEIVNKELFAFIICLQIDKMDRLYYIVLLLIWEMAAHERVFANESLANPNTLTKIKYVLSNPNPLW